MAVAASPPLCAPVRHSSALIPPEQRGRHNNKPSGRSAHSCAAPHCSSSAAQERHTEPPGTACQGRGHELVLHRSHRATVSVFCGHTDREYRNLKKKTRVGLLPLIPPLSSSVSDGPTRSPDHGGEKWPPEFPRERGAQQTGAHEPVRHLGDRRILLQLHPEVSSFIIIFPVNLPPPSRRCNTRHASDGWNQRLAAPPSCLTRGHPAGQAGPRVGHIPAPVPPTRYCFNTADV